ncbi:GNAT family N-acetyltransferase [Actinophytocola gossypii]|uniref:GNAT family N-acetyltransferase n=1 Tax=Actinophytocola gossypii TaxID=2812003 RepID=A0ABT2JCA9_9PSEU|nr:GNAT family N-acetyltransferase [Actinophytocola gossypii]MCT2584949.1 GNAT family N-acetyltransferase [Actinophytocola gossypii]
MSEVTIRAARPAELPEVGRLTAEAYRASGYEVSADYAGKLADAGPRASEAELLVATDPEGHVLGTVTLAPPGSPWAQVATADELEFRMLAVSPAARGRGVGEALTRAAIDRAAELGLSGVALSSGREMAAAHRLYERLGFRRTPDRDWAPLPHVNLVTYRLAL